MRRDRGGQEQEQGDQQLVEGEMALHRPEIEHRGQQQAADAQGRGFGGGVQALDQAGQLGEAERATSRKKLPVRIKRATTSWSRKSIMALLDHVAAQQVLAQGHRRDEAQHGDQQGRLEIEVGAEADADQDDERHGVDRQRVERQHPVDDVGAERHAVEVEQHGDRHRDAAQGDRRLDHAKISRSRAS